MDNNQTIILVDASVYIATFVYWLFKLRRLNVGLIVLAIMTFSHVGSFFYYTVLSELGLLEADIQILPFVYLYSMIMLCILPFLWHEGITCIDDQGYERMILFFTVFVIVINIEPFLENLISLRSSGEDYSELYEDMHNGELKIYSAVGVKLMGWANHFNLFVPALFFYHLTRSKINMKLVVGLGLCLTNLVLYWINMGARGGIVSQFVLYFLAFVLFIPVIPKQIVHRINRFFIIVSIPAIFFFAAITISRYDAGRRNTSLVEWILLYTSEGPIKFNTEMWKGPHNTNGDVNANFLKDLLGMKTYKTYKERDEHYLAKNGRRIEVFYTYVGDFISDFSYIGGIILCLIIFIVERKLLRKDGVIPLHYFIILLFFCQLLAIGFASNMFREYKVQKSFFYMLILFCLFAMSRNNLNTKEETEMIDN